MRMSSAAGALALALGFALVLPATASEPASHDVTAPVEPGATVVVEWTGSALPGASGSGNTCVWPGPDDAHTINLTVPEGAGEFTADFHIEWDEGTSVGGLFTDPDLVLSVFDELPVVALDSSDGGSPEENVSLSNPASGTYTAVVCPFASSGVTPYRARLTLTAVTDAACVDTGVAVPNGRGDSGALPDPEASGLPNFDAFRRETAGLEKAVPGGLHGRYQAPIYDRALGLPTFLWARKDAPVATVGALEPAALLAAHARAHLRSEAKLLKLDARSIDEAEITDAQFNGQGPAVVRLQQRVNGVEVFERSLNVMLDRQYRPIAVSGYFATAFDRAQQPYFDRSAPQAIAAAWTSLGGQLDASALSLAETRGEWALYAAPLLTGSHVFERAPRAKQVWYPRATGLEPAYYVELFANAKVNGQLIAYAFVVSATDGAILHRANLKAEAAYSYRVFADASGPLHQPYDSPLGNGYAPFPAATPNAKLERVGAPSNLVTLEHAGIVTGDPWLPEGATVTTGNNVDACLDVYDVSVNTPAGGLAVPPPVNSCLQGVEPRAPTTGANTFDYPIEADGDPATDNARNAAIVNLFYMNNWLHDWWYNHGFDEVAGNAQDDNYDRGGADGDRLLAHAQDGSGRNNANMATPSDGSSPVMQQYLFDGPAIGEVRITAPVDTGPLAWVPAAFSQPAFNVDGLVALADDGTGVSPSDGCGEAIPNPAAAPIPGATAAPPQSSLSGKIALVDRGSCNFTAKAQFAMASGAIGLIVANNVGGDPIVMGNADIPVGVSDQPTDLVYQQFPSVMIRMDDGERIKALLAAGEVSAHMERQASVDADGTLDNQIIAHEFFHYVHKRLAKAISSVQARSMGEGWGDIDAFMLTVRPDDVLVPGNDNFQGAYGLSGYVANNFFSGIRRAPYTTDFSRNAYTFRHISEGEPTPDGGAGANNSEVHNAGEIWANMMFECYVGVIRNRGQFGQAQARMKDYIVNGLKMTPGDATYTEARDAVLAAVLATDQGDYAACSSGFARRGIGLKAVAPGRSSTDLTGVVEDYTEFTCSTVPTRDGEVYGDSSSPVMGGALGLWLLAPLAGLAALRRRRRNV